MPDEPRGQCGHLRWAYGGRRTDGRPKISICSNFKNDHQRQEKTNTRKRKRYEKAQAHDDDDLTVHIDRIWQGAIDRTANPQRQKQKKTKVNRKH